ncbi:hypothetical protein SAMD00019534_083260 [Acytostelium subglobosum LB1]|uniref:hypothetical protein n=1 Tax=Acytostelium subglobosum LB1 TaxID=1410327 RepID=UPI000644943B|nr:hypothetical protein SAMD00019534_083260 [Acytostelium subglobosum LB1]GAM25151.1 hypothetical protein SAMD00019534_083260 [Acytostelium subglobosum LB1]|eukprot:XP_012751671.1 hypothetical protein SAMD00019534_083260 [Acytostelium subglobosum LB1]
MTKAWFSAGDDDIAPPTIVAVVDQQPNEVQLEVMDDVDVEEEEEVQSLSNVKVGTDYELLTIETLSKYGLSLKRVGGAGDKGIDFRGEWMINSNKYSVIGQCKKVKRKTGPSVLREFESTMKRFAEVPLLDAGGQQLQLQQQRTLIGIMASHSRFMDSVQVEMDSFDLPMIMCQITDNGIHSFMLNKAARQLLPFLRVAIRRVTKSESSSSSSDQSTIELYSHHE